MANLPMSIGVESAEEILNALRATDKFLSDIPETADVVGYRLEVHIDGMKIGYVEIWDDIPNFIPNGDWFGTEVERMG